MRMTRAAKRAADETPTTCLACAQRAEVDEQATVASPPKFEPYILAQSWASAAGMHADGTTIVRRDRYGRWEPVERRRLRADLATHAKVQGWPTGAPVGRLDALEAAARDLLAHMYRRPAEAPAVVDRCAPPTSWANRGEQNALPEPWDSTAVAQVFVRERAYGPAGRELAIVMGSLSIWTGSSWETWGTVERATTRVHADDHEYQAANRNLRDTVAEFVAGGRYWSEADALTSFGPVKAGLVEAVVDVLTVPGDRRPSGPPDVAALDHQRARASETPPVHSVYERDGLTVSTPYQGVTR